MGRATAVLLWIVGGCARTDTGLPAPEIDAVVPDRGANTEETEILIHGRNLYGVVSDPPDAPPQDVDTQFQAQLGSQALHGVIWLDSQSLSAIVPAGLEPGRYALSVTTPAGATARLEEAFLVWAGRQANASLTDIGNNTWEIIEADPANRPPRQIFTYAGMALDTTHGQILMMGSHSTTEYLANDVWAFRLDTLRWRSLYDSDPKIVLGDCAHYRAESPGAVFNPSNEDISDALPSSRHTHDSIEWMPNIARMAMFSGEANDELSFCAGEQQNPRDMWHFDPLADPVTWEYKATPDTRFRGGTSCSAYADSADSSQRLYILANTAGTTNEEGMWAYDGVSDTWELSGTEPTDGIHYSECAMTYAGGQRDRIYVFGHSFPDDNRLWEYDVDADQWNELVGTGVPDPAGGWGLAYDSANDVLIAVRGFFDKGGGNECLTFIYHIATNEWEQMVPLSGVPDCYHRVFGRLKYDPLNNVTLLVTVTSSLTTTWAYRYLARP